MTMIPKVRQMLSIKSHRAIENQFIITTQDAEYFQSYSTIIARRDFDTGKITLDYHYWDFSRTIGKYRNLFLREGIAKTRRKIKEGVYTLANLNSR
jgi:hypothetical protein